VSNLWPFQIPVVSVNLGALGFNAYVEPDQIESFIQDWEAGRTQTSQRMILEVAHWRGETLLREGVAVNDAVLLKNGPQVIQIEVLQGDELVSSSRADGLIVSTPTGSTAYSLSAGGPIVYPTMQALIATAICPHSLASRPVVLPASPELRLSFVPKHGQEAAGLSVDGQESWRIEPEDVITLKAAPHGLRLVTPADMQYFDRLRRKLSWSTDPHAAARSGEQAAEGPGFPGQRTRA
jgi:NAD+ kinase